MKILMVSNDFLPNPGGVANHIAELSKAMVKQGHEVTVLHFCYEKPEHFSEALAGVKIIRKQLAKNLADQQSNYAKITRYLTTIILGSYHIRKTIKFWQPDVIHWHDFYHTSLAMWLIKFKGKKVLTNHASGYLEDYGKGILSQLKLKLYAKPADIVIAPSEELLEKSLILNKPCHFIPNGVDAIRFNPAIIESKEWREKLPANIKIIIAPRRLDPKNGLEHLIKAMPQIIKIIPNVYLLIAGGGSTAEQKKLETLAESLNVQMHYTITGNLPYEIMPNIMALADVIVIPSLMEAVSLAALEALALAKPVIASNIGGLPYVVDDEVGKLVPPADPVALAAAIIEFLQNELLCKRKGQAGRIKIEKQFIWEQIAKQTLQEYCYES
ncbi:MAG: hypothetical protein A3E87_02010 [Gammaproteobacteria bacterium RIFCSPHIGHO2_12_FULL_35_23]|nr:MAG: hypothetical protein A3E87_02010 [Gammaproteobacteria bacterium RIFCSPHIGHO2_12_FULL_35_23]